MTEKAKPVAKATPKATYTKEAIVNSLGFKDQSIAKVILDDKKLYTVQEAKQLIKEWKEREVK